MHSVTRRDDVTHQQAGFAISMLFADVLNRTNIKDQILDVMDEEIANSQEDNPMLAAILPMLKAKVSAVIDERSPELKAMLYCTGLTKLFVRCSFLDRNFQSRMPLRFTPLLRLKLLHACDPMACLKMFALLPVDAVNPNQTRKVVGVGPVRAATDHALCHILLNELKVVGVGPVLTLTVTSATPC
jgi:hypothetical protein